MQPVSILFHVKVRSGFDSRIKMPQRPKSTGSLRHFLRIDSITVCLPFISLNFNLAKNLCKKKITQ